MKPGVRQERWADLTVSQVAEILQVHPNTVLRYLHTGRLKGRRGERRKWYVTLTPSDILGRRKAARVADLIKKAWPFSTSTRGGP